MTDELGHEFLTTLNLCPCLNMSMSKVGVFWANLVPWIILVLSRKNLEGNRAQLHQNCWRHATAPWVVEIRQFFDLAWWYLEVAYECLWLMIAYDYI